MSLEHELPGLAQRVIGLVLVLYGLFNKILNDYGWIQGKKGNQREGFCLIGALHWASTKTSLDNEYEAFEYLQQATQAQDLAVWNDLPGRTKDQVLGVIRKAGELCVGNN